MIRNRLAGAVLTCTALVLVFVAALPGARPAFADKTIAVKMIDYAFQPDTLRAAPGEKLTLELDNQGIRLHNIVFELPSGVATSQNLMGGEKGTYTFDAPSAVGSYVFYCSIGQHRAQGMEGKLFVDEAPKSVPLKMLDYSFQPDTLHASPSETVTLDMENAGIRLHNIVFEFPGGNVSSQNLMGGQKGTYSFGAPAAPGTYVYFCSIGQHRAMGMVGQLVVDAAPTTVGVKMSEYKFEPDTLNASTSESMTLDLDNIGNAPHNIKFELPGGVVGSDTIMAGQKGTYALQVPAEPGNYLYYCSIGQHRANGMEGKLVVSADIVTPAATVEPTVTTVAPTTVPPTMTPISMPPTATPQQPTPGVTPTTGVNHHYVYLPRLLKNYAPDQ